MDCADEDENNELDLSKDESKNDEDELHSSNSNNKLNNTSQQSSKQDKNLILSTTSDTHAKIKELISILQLNKENFDRNDY